MKVTTLFILSLLVFFTPAKGKQNSIKYPLPSSTECGFYLKLEEQLGCVNETPYLTHYGYVYCNRFQKELKKWTGQLAKWVPPTTQCLQASLIENPAFLSPCRIMMDHAFGTHPTCYMKSGFCDLSFVDKQRILNVVAWSDVIAEFGQSVAQALRIKSGCNMQAFEAFFHFADFIFQITRAMDTLAKTDAAEIVVNTPPDASQAQSYMNRMYATILYGDSILRDTDISAVAKYSSSAKLIDLDKTIDTCNQSTEKFCKEFRKRNASIYSSEVSMEKQKTKFIENTLPERLRAARLSIKKGLSK